MIRDLLMKRIIYNIIKTFTVLAFCALVIVPFVTNEAEAATSAETLNLAYVKMNQSGEGYYWDNINRVLTLTDLVIETEEDFGIRLPENATIELKGTSRIKAGKYALGCPSNVSIKGKGELILESGDSAIFVHSKTDSHKFRIFDGKITAKGTLHAIKSEIAEISITGGEVSFESAEGAAVNSRVFSVTGGEVSVNGGVFATHLIRINEAEVNVTNTVAEALDSENLLELENVKILVGSKKGKLTEAQEYNGEKYFSTEPVSPGPRDSILFGEGVPITVDYALLIGAILLVAAAIALPIVRKHIKTKKLYASLEAEKAEKEKK